VKATLASQGIQINEVTLAEMPADTSGFYI